jgi:hypothetical protein
MPEAAALPVNIGRFFRGLSAASDQTALRLIHALVIDALVTHALAPA